MKKILNKNSLQFIAIIAMTLDHLTWVLFKGYSTHPLAIILHILGRLAFPIFAFFIAEGYHYTSSKKKYLLRLGLFALISHAPYMMASINFQTYGPSSFIPFYCGDGITRFINQTNVLVSYFIGILMLMVNDSKRIKEWIKPFIILVLCVFSFPADWSCIGSLVVLSIGSNRSKPIKQILWSLLWIILYALVYIFSMDLTYGLIQFGVFLAIPLLALYNGQKSKSIKLNKVMRWFFYIYYPLHLLILGFLNLI